MPTKILVSYDGTDADLDALALGRLLRGAGAELALAYVRHAKEAESGRERLAEDEAEALLSAGAAQLGGAPVGQHVVMSGSTPEGLRQLAITEHADMVVFGSEYRTPAGRVSPQASAARLLDGGPVAIALAPSGFARRGDVTISTIGVVGEDGDPCALETAQALAARLGATVANHPTGDVDIVVVGSKPGTVHGRVTISAAATYLIELSRCPVIVLPRGAVVGFGE